jgi:chemotaxis protein MotA
MNLLFGLLCSFGIIFAMIKHSNVALDAYINFEGLIVVLGGTITIFFMGNSFKSIKNVIKLCWNHIIKKRNHKKLAKELVEYSSKLERGIVPKDVRDPFVAQCMNWISVGVKGEELETLLDSATRNYMEKKYSAVSSLKKLTKYPPALGMIGTVFGIISIFRNLGSDGGAATIGLSLGVAMTATLYGLVVANFLISPLAELLHDEVLAEQQSLNMVTDTVRQWSEKENLFMIKENIQLYNKAS